MIKKILNHLQGKSSGLSLRIVSSSESSFAFFISLFALTSAYRVQFTIGLFTNPVRPFDFNPAYHPLWFILSYLPYDLGVALLGYLLAWLLSRWPCFTKGSRPFLILKISGLVFLHVVLIVLLLIHGSHTYLLFNAQTGLDYSIIKETFLNVSFPELIQFVKLNDLFFLLIPIGLFWMVRVSPSVLKIGMLRGATLLILFILLASLYARNYKKSDVPIEVGLNPALFLLYDIAANRFYEPPTEERTLNHVQENELEVQFARPIYDKRLRPVSLLPVNNTPPWNIVFFIMESVGTRYMFDTSYGNPMPMPFLHQLAKGSWHLKKHYAASNISTKAIFSLLSGVYDFFNRETFGIRPDASVPSIKNYLNENYDSFLVTPTSINWYFPKAFLKNNGWVEMHSHENVPFKIKEEKHALGRYMGRDEIQTVDFFTQRISRAKEPFLGIYLSFAAHLPYFDYGPDYRIMEDDGRSISRYYNNLNLLDHMLKRIYEHLKIQGLLERTLLVMIGDHGQAFGQHHPDNYMHYRYSYNENLETPAIIYQPLLFKPKAYEYPSSHVDILPTLLDAMRIPYDPLHFDGKSLFQNKVKRKYIFFYGHEGTLSSLSDHQIKVQYSFKKNRCWAFDLKNDPEERNPLDGSLYPQQLKDLRQFADDHDSKLIRYNEWLRERKSYSAKETLIVMKRD